MQHWASLYGLFLDRMCDREVNSNSNAFGLHNGKHALFCFIQCLQHSHHTYESTKSQRDSITCTRSEDLEEQPIQESDSLIFLASASTLSSHSMILSFQGDLSLTFKKMVNMPAATAAKSLQSCLTLCDPTNGSPPGSPIPGTLQARALEWVAISFSNAWKWKVKVKSLSRVLLLVTPRTSAYQAPPPMGFSRQEYWSGVPLPSPRYAWEAVKGRMLQLGGNHGDDIDCRSSAP